MFEYKVTPAPSRGIKEKGLKTPEDRFAKALSDAINTEAAEGWEYLRTDTLPSEERNGLRNKTTVFRNMLVFRRTKSEIVESAPVAAPAPAAAPVLTHEDDDAPAADDLPEVPNRNEPPLTAS